MSYKTQNDFRNTHKTTTVFSLRSNSHGCPLYWPQHVVDSTIFWMHFVMAAQKFVVCFCLAVF